MESIQDILAQNLSGGQKRKLTLGIAILGDPQVRGTKITGNIRLRTVKLLHLIRVNLQVINVKRLINEKLSARICLQVLLQVYCFLKGSYL